MYGAVAAFVLITLIGVGGGAVLGTMVAGEVLKSSTVEDAGKTAASGGHAKSSSDTHSGDRKDQDAHGGKATAAHGDSGEEAGDDAAPESAPRLLGLPAITSNLADPKDVWVRLEAGVVVAGALDVSDDVFVGQLTQDILGVLRSTKLKHLEGATGLLHLREDLSDRARVRSKGAVREIVVRSMVVE